MKRYFKIFFIWSSYSAEIALQSRFGAILFIMGKFIRFGFFLFFIIIISSRVKAVGGYSLWQMIFLYSTFNFIDVFTQLFLREVYRFRSYVVSGNLDYYLVRPISPLARFLFGGADILDLPLLIISIGLLIYSALHIGGIIPLNILTYVILITNSLVIAFSFHMIVLALGILTSEVDNTLWLYRDLTTMGRFPIDIYKEPIRWMITFIIPVGIMMTFPVKALLGILSPALILFSVLISLAFVVFGYSSWKFAIRRYSSASS